MSSCARTEAIDAVEIADLKRVEIAVEPWSWEFAHARSAQIAAHFAELQRERPALWNGRVLLMHRCTVAGDRLRGACFETDYASFLAWRDWGFPDAAVANVFAAAALQGADGGYLLGEMAPSTANAGLVYFPCGTPGPEDIGARGTLDLAGSLRRELREETGLAIDTLAAERGWRFVRDGRFFGLVKRLTSRHSAEQLRAQILRHIAGERQPELADVRIARGRADLDARMARFAVAFLRHVWRQ
jgi:8-oxo-dGTP pyrophosphatase MutT (NUDIX family)